MVWTSAVIPPAAVAHRVAGWWRHRHSTAWPTPPRAVLFDRDGTLVTDVPYNGDPDLVQPMPGAAEAVASVRARGVPTGVVSNQSGIARGLLSTAQVSRVNSRVDRLLGPFDTWQVCPHGPDDGCACRKPNPGLVLAAARDLGVPARDCVVIGDIGSDVARRARRRCPRRPRADRRHPPRGGGRRRSGGAGPAQRRRPRARRTPMTQRPSVLAVRLDSDGDVLLTGPALRALRAGADRLDLLVSPAGAHAAALLPGIDDLLVFDAPWSGFSPADGGRPRSRRAPDAAA